MTSGGFDQTFSVLIGQKNIATEMAFSIICPIARADICFPLDCFIHASSSVFQQFQQT